MWKQNNAPLYNTKAQILIKENLKLIKLFCIIPIWKVPMFQSKDYVTPKQRCLRTTLLITDGTVHQMVDELDRAWHAGVSFWAEEEDINSSSIGIELQNKGQQHGYEDFYEAQIDSLIILMQNIKSRYKIVKQNVLAHSDISPERKIDPDHKFPWHKLAATELVIVPNEVDTDIELTDLLDMIGYNISNPVKAIEAFQRRYRPSKIDGKSDTQCQALAMGVIMQTQRV